MSNELFDRILASKQALRRSLVQLTIDQKLSMVEQLAERAMQLRKDTSRPVPSQPWTIPVGWQWRRLGDVARIVSGTTPSTDHPEYFGGDVVWVRISDLTLCQTPLLTASERTLTAFGIAQSGAQVVPVNTVLWSTRVPMGHVAIAGVPLALHQGVKGLVLTDALVPEFVYYFLQIAQDFLEPLSSGIVMKEITATNAARLPIPVPPLGEQKALVRMIQERCVTATTPMDRNVVLAQAFVAPQL